MLHLVSSWASSFAAGLIAESTFLFGLTAGCLATKWDSFLRAAHPYTAGPSTGPTNSVGSFGPTTTGFCFCDVGHTGPTARQVLLRCDSTGDLYPVTDPSPIPYAFLVSQHTWHQRLGHPGGEVLRHLVSSNFISYNEEKPPVLCHAYQLGKQ
ncbi:ribonuclease H-like domain-containing protein [Tanacetum coccineum]